MFFSQEMGGLTLLFNKGYIYFLAHAFAVDLSVCTTKLGVFSYFVRPSVKMSTRRN